MENVLQYYEALVESAFLDIDSIYTILHSDFTGKINYEGAKFKKYLESFIPDFKTNKVYYYTRYFSKLSKLKKQTHKGLDLFIEKHIKNPLSNENIIVIDNFLVLNKNIADIINILIDETGFDNILTKEEENRLLENKYYEITFDNIFKWSNEFLAEVKNANSKDAIVLFENDIELVFFFNIGFFKIKSDFTDIEKIKKFFDKYDSNEKFYSDALVVEEFEDKSTYIPLEFNFIIEEINNYYNDFEGFDKVKEFIKNHKGEVRGNSIKNDIVQLILEVGICQEIIICYIIGNLTYNFIGISDIEKYNVLNDYSTYIKNILNYPKYRDYSVESYTIGDYSVIYEILEQIQFMKSLVNLSAEDKREYDLKEYYKNKKLYWRGDLKDFSETFMPLIKRYKIRNNDPHDETRNRDNFEPIFRKLSEIFLVEKEKMKNSNEKYTEYLTETALLSGLKKKKTQKN